MPQPTTDSGPRFRWLARSGPELEAQLDFAPRLLIVRLTGRLTGRSGKPLRSILYDAWSQRPERVAIDTTALTHYDESGLKALAGAVENAAVAAAPPVGIVGLGPRHREVVQQLCADGKSSVRTFAAMAEAVEALLAVPGAPLPDKEILLAEIQHLHRALLSRAAIDQAKGILMAVYGLEAEAAFAMLAWHSRESRIPLRELVTRFLAAVRDLPAGSLTVELADSVFADITHPRDESVRSQAQEGSS
ncbi:ANTAR domain-containing protein [Kribbella sp. CA-293567]|uniref:ANTAR domain-containing protein n=1 Tax=Kribbella sp. CA-293567 TaxID=3002436 RepID=UPI0022DD9B9B|nr:ANTAR domain-containing protein [Kribbella sp. CA-293567]WBQ08302.1 ANTAR domain-containing protein [Kribbella sp. CA-293567]